MMNAENRTMHRLAAMLLISCSAYAEDYRYNRPIQADYPSAPLWAITLDEAVYRGSNDSLSDLRLMDNQGQETPYLLQTARQTQTRSSRQISASQAPKLRPDGERSLEIIVALDNKAQAVQGFTLFTEQHDFEYDLQVFGSDDGQNWQLLLENARIYDYARYMAVSNHEVALPDNPYRQFKIVVVNAVQSHAGQIMEVTRTLHGNQEQQRNESQRITQQALHIQRIEFWHQHSETVAGVEQLGDYPISEFQVSEDNQQQTTLIDFDSARQPLNAVKLDIATPNYKRNVELQIAEQQNLQTRYQTIAHSTLQAIHVADIQRDPQPIEFATQKSGHYRLVIHNQDNPPLTIKAITAIGPLQQLLFLPQAGQSYQLRYGQPKATLPHYDTAAIQELLNHQHTPQLASLAAEQDNPQAASQAPIVDYQNWLNSNGFLTGAISLMVAGLVWSLIGLGRKLK